MILNPVPLTAIEAAHRRISRVAQRTPLVKLEVDAPSNIYLKLECLQPIGSFKIRGAANAMYSAEPSSLTRGVWTASAGNMAQGVAWCAREFGVPCTVVVPDHAPATKLRAIERLGGRVVKWPFADWWQLITRERSAEGEFEGLFVHPVSDANVIAGNGTIGLEILEDLPDVEAVVVPYGGGGLSSGIASAIKPQHSYCRVLASEVETAAPLAPSLAAGTPTTVKYTASFVDGIGGSSVLPAMWPLVSTLLDGSIVVGLRQVADAIRLLVERSRVVAEGAAGSAVAAALSGRAGKGSVVAVVSGGNIDSLKLARILEGHVP